MAQILIRNLDENVVAQLKRRAGDHGRSLQSEVRNILEQAVQAPQVDMEAARALIEGIRTRLRGRPFPDSVALVREDRDR